MTLDFAQLTDEIVKMAAAYSKRQLTQKERLKLALQWLHDWSGREDEIHERVQQATSVQYRGASPIGAPKSQPVQGPPEPVAEPVGFPYGCLNRLTVIAVDGSQIYPDPQSDIHYYLLNLSVIAMRHGLPGAPRCETRPQLIYSEDDLYLKGQLINNATINAQRTIAEREKLAEAVKKYGDADPVIALADGPLLYWEGSEAPEGQLLSQITLDYLDALQKVKTSRPPGLALAGYVDKPTSTYVIRLLRLLSLEPEQVSREALATNGPLEGLEDRLLFEKILTEPGDRSALFVQRSPTNREYAKYDRDLEIAFFYMNTAPPNRGEYVVRIEIPVWVARDRQLVDEAQTFIYNQCQLLGRYPYILTRADELAVVRGHEKAQLDNLIEIELRKHGFNPEPAEKPLMKTLARH
ncbi:MAG: DNA double-strand break repair nuclease NurA [Anaerolineae bacterium]|nr:DNA double-strand break repair nuclease NurA [Anaerolineae bacterium]